MTSKEAIGNIICLLINTDDLALYIKEIEAIENDLKILEILKKYLKLSPVVGLGTQIYNDVLLIPIENEDDNKKVQEWLKNDK